MNPDYLKTRFRFSAPPEGLPASFAVITACNPDGVPISPDENAARTEAFRSQLAECGHRIFPVTGFDPDSPHHEAGFGVVCEKSTALGFGRQWEQDAIFWVEDGDVWIVSCIDPSEEVILGNWVSLADP